MAGKRDFFISYNRADQEWAEWIAFELEKAAYSTVVQAWDFAPGANFVLKMHAAAQQTRHTIAVLSDDYMRSGFTSAEWTAAFAADPTGIERRLIPVRVRECEPSGLLGAIVYLDLVGLSKEEARRRLLEGVRRGRRKPGSAAWPGWRRRVARIVMAAVAGAAGWWYWSRPPELYQVRVLAVREDGSGVDADSATLTASAGAEVKRAGAGWEVAVPRAALPANGRVTFSAALGRDFLEGEVEVVLARDANPAVTVVLRSDRTAKVRGVVQDEQGRAVAGAEVSVEGRAGVVTSDPHGFFEIAAGAADGQAVTLRVRRQGFAETRTDMLAGGTVPATVVLARR